MREGNVMADEGFTELAGRRVTLRRFHRDDLTTFVAYRSSEQVARFQSWDAPYRREEGERFIQDIARQHSRYARGMVPVRCGTAFYRTTDRRLCRHAACR
jgi:RimJ/RimL family protein N-acetyltransferase